MADFDLILRNGLVGKEAQDIGVIEGKIAAIGSNLTGSADSEISVTGKRVFPGFIDAHVHFNEPGRAEWEGIATGSKALAAGGGTVFCDMPLNSTPPVIDRASFLRKREIGEKKSRIDFALWGGLIPGNREEIPALAKEGAIGLKAFMAHSGLDEFPRVTPADLKAGMKVAAENSLLVAVHAESQEYLDTIPESKNGGVRGFLDSRPVGAEVEAIRIACDIAGETGCRLHIVHVSSAEGISEVLQAKESGVDVTAETCPHYLLFCEEDMSKPGAIAKCAPPLRKRAEVDALIRCLESGEIDTVGSDHSPCLPEMKSGDFAGAWGGIASCQHAFPAFLDKFPDWENLICLNPARRMGLAHRKGSIEPGKDADFAIIDFSKSEFVEEAGLLYRHPVSPYVGRKISCRVEMTFCRGRLVHGESELPFDPACDGQFLAGNRGL